MSGTRIPQIPDDGRVKVKGHTLDFSNVRWHNSSRAKPGSNSVEAAFVGGFVVLRASSNPEGPYLIFDMAEWDAFEKGARDGEFDDKTFDWPPGSVGPS